MAYILIIVVTLILLHFSAPLLLGLFGDHCKLALKLMKMELEKIGISRTKLPEQHDRLFLEEMRSHVEMMRMMSSGSFGRIETANACVEHVKYLIESIQIIRHEPSEYDSKFAIKNEANSFTKNSYLYENFGNLMHEGWQVDSRPSTAD
jgi:hypothetical protein